jgi:tRNA-splicing ligase RtcB
MTASSTRLIAGIDARRLPAVGRRDDDAESPSLDAIRHTDRVLEFATRGSGNHFIELQTDEDGRLWLIVHSGSRGIGPAIRDHRLARAETIGSGLRAPGATNAHGAMYLQDVPWARRFARRESEPNPPPV